jgi:hypothetical protein
MAAERAPVLTPQDYAEFGRWLAELMADAWRNGLRARPSDVQTAEGRTPRPVDVRPSRAEQEERGVTSTGSVAILRDG